ncbi:4Fe-4S dicluster domain-containing protein [Desulfuribacillus alkaliarsenatis]|uniref:4Fe-4S ferredoxin-type domain-containing protein n=1 Tax=Desulfuribacillus alkaliarsenatis TaxID=766136 RepID=A0A1E5G2C8_9FIRM|nr:4Fe-4S dicluster domain-containing protein [Desulfuribacillus alkaliarsenatis]OEF97057.1 hypothetical protein BHF68_05510 [Desulfuribacillus alkaliarsenatis]
MVRMARLIDVTRCTACRGCQVTCKDWNQLPGEIGEFTGSYQSHMDNSPLRWTMIKFFEEEKSNGDVQWVFRKHSCNHCGDPGCLKACPNNALAKSELGAVYRIEENCIGCGYCVPFCPFDIPKIDEVNEKMKKCTFCIDRIANDLRPACEKTCMPGAIMYGSWDEMSALADKRLEAAQKRFPNAQIYGKNELGGLGNIYVLPDGPQNYELPVNPTLAPTLGMWKDIVQPFGNLAIAATLIGTGLAFLFTRRKAFVNVESSKLAEGGYHDEQKNDRAL